MASKKTGGGEEEDLGMDLGALSAAFLGGLGDALETAAGGGPALFKLVKLSLLEEDPDNPRRHFAAESLRELAEVIKERGFNSAIRIRKNPDKPGHFLICEGHRRYRAARLAGLEEIPALVSDNFERLDQVLENLKRDPLTDFEMARFIKGQIDQGAKKAELAKRLRVSPAYITQHLALLNMSEALAHAYRENRLRDLTGIANLVHLEKSHPAEVAAWLKRDGEISRDDVARLKTRLENNPPEGPVSGPETSGGPRPSKVKAKTPPLAVLVKAGGREARLMTEREAKSPRHAWIRFSDNGLEKEVPVRELELFEMRRLF